jgi:hypothetical protein
MKSFSVLLILNLAFCVLSEDVLSSNYLIKFITPFTEYPVRLIDNFGSYESTNSIMDKSKWFKHGSNCFVDELDQSSKYFSTEINLNGGINLLILKYDATTNLVLDHYEPYHYDKDDEMQQTAKEMYTLVYLKSFELKIDETENEIKASCELTLIIPIGIADEHTEIINENIQETLSLDFKYDDQTQDNLHLKSKKHKRLHQKHSNSKRDANSKASKFEQTYSTGSFNFNKYTFQSDQKTVNVTCNIVLRDFDNSHAFDTSLSKSLDLNKKNSLRPVVGQNLNGAGKVDLGLLSFLTLLTTLSFLSKNF